MRRTPKSRSIRVPLAVLEPYYPDGAAINSKEYGQAVYIARRARQMARRTASIQHYEVAWAPPQRRLTIDEPLMWELVKPPSYLSIDRAVERLREGLTYSVAISPELILSTNATSGEGQGVIYLGEETGALRNGLYVPEYEGSCYTKLTRAALQELGVSCL